jgi:hypothetical protein
MPRHTPTINPELKAHQEWLGYLQPVGLVVAPAAMVDAGWVVTRSGSELIERQERYREAIEASPAQMIAPIPNLKSTATPERAASRSCKPCWWNTWAGVPIRSKASPP